ncbi:phosphonate C-P lyase system protein PhnH [Taklimakanibacter deserti]|uniref:phosphonate C-P lyase system protein PhnH n=1 Tax=Taklimakanibacter deserti TaxID=2267839 RepID=UPI000E65B28A
MIEAVSGFADQALDSARAFRLMLDAMARPGLIVPMQAGLDAPSPLLPTAATICLTLCDYDTPLWLDEAYRTPQVLDYLRFHSGAPIVEEISAASFLLCSEATAALALASANRGTAEYPDISATLIVQLASFTSDERLILNGPGIDGMREFGALGLEQGFWDLMEDNHALFPLGSDVFFATSREIAALPRSTRIRREGQD